MKKHLVKLCMVLATAAMLLASGCATGTQPTITTPPVTYKPTYTYTQPPFTSGIPTPSITVTSPPITITGIPTLTMPTQYPPATTHIPAPTIILPTVTVPGGTAVPAPGGNIGLAVGGAKDIQNFRENIRSGYLPLPTDVTYEGLFYDYYFDTGETQPGEKLFNPSYSFAVTEDPLSGKTEYYLAVGLNSGMKESDFARKKLNLVIVLDNSGSMGESYNRYYYDSLGNYRDIYAEGGPSQRKIDSARDSVISLLNQLNPDDRVSIVLFNSTASLVQPIGLVNNTDMNGLVREVSYISAGGSTNLDAGMDMASAQFRGLREVNSYEYENRIIILSDAQPNTGDFSSSGLFNNMRTNADSRIYTTFIGIGVDFNTDLIEQISKIKGANYYSAHSYYQFKQRIEEEFDFMVTPLVFNLRFYFEATGWQIDKVFGSPEADTSTGDLLRINTLFPAKTEGGETRGGIVLLKLSKTSFFSGQKVFLKVSYEDHNGKKDSSEAMVELDRKGPEYFDNNGIRKAVLLTRYAALLKNWMMDERNHMNYSQPWNPCIGEGTGIAIPNEALFSQWERQSLPVHVSAGYKKLFEYFKEYFEDEMDAIGDKSLSNESGILYTLSK
jgi:Ca-activated chloride channel family protein